MRRQLLDPIGNESVEVVHRLGAIRAQLDRAAEVAVHAESGPPPTRGLADEVERLAAILDLPLQLSVETA
jgi:hypothetical protein